MPPVMPMTERDVEEMFRGREEQEGEDVSGGGREEGRGGGAGRSPGGMEGGMEVDVLQAQTAQTSNDQASTGSDDMPPHQPSLSHRLSGGPPNGGTPGRLGRTISTLLRRVSSLGSEGWSEDVLRAEEEGGAGDDDGLQVDFDEIWRGEGRRGMAGMAVMAKQGSDRSVASDVSVDVKMSDI